MYTTFPLRLRSEHERRSPVAVAHRHAQRVKRSVGAAVLRNNYLLDFKPPRSRPEELPLKRESVISLRMRV